MKDIIIFGGTGFIGHSICKRAIKKKYKEISVSKNPPLRIKRIKNVKYINFDITKKKNFKKISNNFDIVINASGYGAHFKGKKGLKLYKEHLNGLKNIVEHFKKKKIDKFIQIGTSFEYKKNSLSINENWKTEPISSYGKAKLKISKYLLKLNKIENYPVTIFRVFQVYGPNQDVNRIIPYLIIGLKNNKSVQLTSGNQYRDFCYIDDILNAIFASIKNKKSNGNIFNLGTGKRISIKELAKKIYKKIKKGKLKLNEKKLHYGEYPIMIPNISKARKILKWMPKISLDKGLLKTIKTIK